MRSETRIGVWSLALLVQASLVLAPLMLTGCGDASARQAEEPPLRVFAAASLTDVVDVLAQSYDGPVVSNFGSSSSLARQIRDGAPADVFLSASPRWIDALRQSGALADTPRVLVGNRLVAVAPSGSRLASLDVDGPESLLHHLDDDALLAIADDGVPAGEYTRASLRHADVWDAYRPRLVGQRDVRAVLRAVEGGQLPAGFVYVSDAQVAEVEVLFELEPRSHPPIRYQAVVLRGASNLDAARTFLSHLESDDARALFQGAGFSMP